MHPPASCITPCIPLRYLRSPSRLSLARPTCLLAEPRCRTVVGLSTLVHPREWNGMAEWHSLFLTQIHFLQRAAQNLRLLFVGKLHVNASLNSPFWLRL